MKRNFILIFIIISGFFAVNAQDDKTEKGKQELIDTDIAFSKLSEEKGSHQAFLAYWDDNGVLLRPNSYPVIGKNEIKKLYDKNLDQSYTLTWKPLNADISQSCDLGFTYGIWTLTYNDKDGKIITEHGTYATVWRKNAAGNWKMALDTGNDGLEPK